MGKAQESNDYGFRKVPEFDQLSRNNRKCSISNTAMVQDGPGRQPHEVDGFVLRGPSIAHEGFFDIRPSVLRALALEFTDLVPPGDAEVAEALHATVNELNAELNEQSQELDAAYRALGNATARFADEEPEEEPELLEDYDFAETDEDEDE